MGVLEERLKTLEDGQSDLKESVVEHRMRLENGVAVFAKTGKRIAALEEVTRPKPPRILTVVGITVTIVMTAGGALWGLSSQLNSRPTTNQIERIMENHDTAGHIKFRKEMSGVEVEQGKQRVIIENVQKDQAVIRSMQDTSLKKLDTLIRRVRPRSRNGRRNR